MQSSYNLIRNNNVVVNGGKAIETKIYRESEDSIVDNDEYLEERKQNEENFLRSYETIGANIISKAKHDAQSILISAAENAKVIEKEAYERGYEQGKSNGYEDGYNEGYPIAIDKGNKEVSQVINLANSILTRANGEYLEFLQNKKEEIINLAFEMAKVIAGKEVEKTDSILALLEPMIEECKGEENLVIKCNSKYIKSVTEKISFWKSAYTIKGEIFVLEDPLLELGNAIVEKKTGKIVVGMDIALEKLQEVIKLQCLGGKDA